MNDITEGPQAPSEGPPQAAEPQTHQSSAGWSSYGTFRECARQFAWTYRRSAYADHPPTAGGTPGGGDREVGTFVHELLSRWYLHVQAAPRPDPRNLSDAEVLDIAKSSGLTTAQRLEEALRLFDWFHLYTAHWAATDARWEILSVEQEHAVAFVPLGPGGEPFSGVGLPEAFTCVPLGEPPSTQPEAACSAEAAPLKEVAKPLSPGGVLATARLDLVVRERPSGRVIIVDHKKASTIYPDVQDHYGVTGQIHGHQWIGKAYYGAMYFGELLNFFQTEGSPKFARRRPTAAPAMVAEHPYTIWATAQEIALWDRIARNARDWPKKSGYFCTRCDFVEFCKHGLG